MKLLVTGATGLVGTEVIRLALQHPSVTSVIAIARRPVAAPADAGANASKLTSIVLKDFLAPYPATVQAQIAGANACIWHALLSTMNLSVTPNNYQGRAFDEVTRVSSDYALFGVEQMLAAADAGAPFRFVYTSAALSERDQARSLSIMAKHRLMRGHTENKMLELQEQHRGRLEIVITQPGIIDGRFSVAMAAMAKLIALTGVIAKVHVSEIAAAEIGMAVNGFDKDTIKNDELVEIGQRMLKEDYLR